MCHTAYAALTLRDRCGTQLPGFDKAHAVKPPTRKR